MQYQSASAVLTGAIGLVVGVPLAFSWSLYLLLALWPLCVYWTARLLGWSRWEAGTAAVISPLLFSVTGRGFEDQAYVWLGQRPVVRAVGDVVAAARDRASAGGT